jgi:cardiolipin synthase
MSKRRKKLADKYTAANEVTLIRGGKDYFVALLQLIGNARETIHFQTYIFKEDETGRLVTEALKDAVKKKVQVYLMADGYASQDLSATFIAELKSAGIHFRFFEPVFKSNNFYFGRRMHYKVVVADATSALVGGVNVANKYNDMPGKPAWLDFALLVTGQVSMDLCIQCKKTWKGYQMFSKIVACRSKLFDTEMLTKNICEVRMRCNDWVWRKNDISRTYIEMLNTATSHVTILCSYFLPGKTLRRQMELAIKKGVTIKVIAAGPSDVMLSKYAERWLYDWLLRLGIELYEYQRNILHAKIAVCDNQWMTIGSYNINNISAYASMELNLDVRNAAFAKNTGETLEQLIADDCMRITHENLLKTRNVFKQVVRWLSYQFIRLVFYLFTFYFRQRS